MVSAILESAGPSRRILESCREERLVLITSADQLMELRDVLDRPRIRRRLRLNESELEAILNWLRGQVYSVRPQATAGVVVRDPDDDKILAIALSARADYLLTGDRDLLTLADDVRIAPLAIRAPAAFVIE